MQIQKYKEKEQWLKARRAKITGTRLEKIVSAVGLTKETIVKELGTLQIEFKKSLKKDDLFPLLPKTSVKKLERELPKKIGFYELIAERLGVPADDESPMDRGTRLEPEAVAMFAKEAKKKVNTDLVILTRDDNEYIALSPDGLIGKTEAVEAKCLSSARHIEAFLTQKIPSEYEMQMLQYFIVAESLKTLYFVFYDPRILVKPFFYLTISRKEVQDKVDTYLEYQRKTLEEVDEVVLKLTY